jgi:pilus assembly protein CpaE
MFFKAGKSAVNRPLVSVISGEEAFARRSKAALEASGRYRSEVAALPTGEAQGLQPSTPANLHIVELSTGDRTELAALERHMAAHSATPVIVVSKGLAENGARQFLKLGVADWLPCNCSDEELLNACDQALRSKYTNGPAVQARCIAFMSAVGGAGATTLSLAAVLALASKSRDRLRRMCAVDLDVQRGTLAEYANLLPALQLDEIASIPERLDRHLLGIMLTRHASGLAVLSAPASLTGAHGVNPEVIGRLLDLAAADFEELILDLPSCWQPWCEDIVGGLDAFYIVTEMTVTGLRQARRLAEMLQERGSFDTSRSVIVNKSRRFGGNVTRNQARAALGPLLAGFVSNGGDAVRRAQDRGAMLAALGSRARIVRDLAALLTAAQKSTPGQTITARSAHP